jgi:hypothetical protein
MYRVWGLLLTVAATVGLCAEDVRLKELRDILVPMRADKLQYPRPGFTAAKHLLREWIESRLGTVRDIDLALLAKQLNDELARAKLSWNSAQKDVNDVYWSAVGYVGDVSLEWQPGFLVVRTGVGLQCGFDESAYAYEFKDDHWKRYWQSEQNDYRKDKYFPQTLQAVLISRERLARVFKNEHVDRSEHLVLTLGYERWCSSNWHNVYYRVWRTGDRYPEPKLLLDKLEWALVAVEPPIVGDVDPDQVLVEYIVNDPEPGFRMPVVRDYRVKNGRIARVDPIALGPRNFVAAWFELPSSENSGWTEPPHRRAMLAAGRKGGDPLRHTMHCKQPDLWQVSIDVSKALDGSSSEYFLVRWRPPFHFTMVDVSDHPWPGCTQEDPEADEWRTMFRPPGWQWERDTPH